MMARSVCGFFRAYDSTPEDKKSPCVVPCNIVDMYHSELLLLLLALQEFVDSERQSTVVYWNLFSSLLFFMK
jgi:hypothetical protein